MTITPETVTVLADTSPTLNQQEPEAPFRHVEESLRPSPQDPQYKGFTLGTAAVTIMSPMERIWALLKDPKSRALILGPRINLKVLGASRFNWTLTTKRRQISVETELFQLETPDQPQMDGSRRALMLWENLALSNTELEIKLQLRASTHAGAVVAEALVAYRYSFGRMAARLATLQGADPVAECRMALKRLRMLAETGEIAVSHPQPEATATEHEVA